MISTRKSYGWILKNRLGTERSWIGDSERGEGKTGSWSHVDN